MVPSSPLAIKDQTDESLVGLQLQQDAWLKLEWQELERHWD